MNQITNEQYEDALNNQSNMRIMNKAAYQYKRVIGDHIESCKLDALLISLKNYDSSRGMKFTSFLYENVKRVCWAEAEKIKKDKQKQRAIHKYFRDGKSQIIERNYLVEDLLMSLNKKDYKLFRDRFLYNKTLKEIGNEYGVTLTSIHERLVILKKKIKSILSDSVIQ